MLENRNRRKDLDWHTHKVDKKEKNYHNKYAPMCLAPLREFYCHMCEGAIIYKEHTKNWFKIENHSTVCNSSYRMLKKVYAFEDIWEFNSHDIHVTLTHCKYRPAAQFNEIYSTLRQFHIWQITFMKRALTEI